MKQIQEYQLHFLPEQYIMIEKGSIILSAMVKNDSLFLTTIFDDNIHTYETISIRIITAGNHLPDDVFTHKFIGTVVYDSKGYHIFQIINN